MDPSKNELEHLRNEWNPVQAGFQFLASRSSESCLKWRLFERMYGPTNGRTNEWPDQRMAGPTNGQNQRMAKFQVNGQILDFFKTANGHGHSPNRQNSNRRMASPNTILSLP